MKNLFFLCFMLCALVSFKAICQQEVVNLKLADEIKRNLQKKYDSLKITKEQELTIIEYLRTIGATNGCYASGGGCGSCPTGQYCTQDIRGNCLCINDQFATATAKPTVNMTNERNTNLATCVNMTASLQGTIWLSNNCNDCVTVVMLATRYISGHYLDIPVEQRVNGKSQIQITQPPNQLRLAITIEKPCK